MDELTNRKTAGGLSFSRKATTGLALRDSGENRDRNTQMCSRLGCDSKVNSTKVNRFGGPSKAKTTRHPFSSGKEVAGSSSRSPTALSGPRKLCLDPRKKLPSQNIADLKLNDLSGKSDASETVIKPDNAPNVSGEAGSSSSIPRNKYGKKTLRRSEPGVYDSTTGSSTSSAFKRGNDGSRFGGSTSKCNLRNLKCTSLNDVVPSGCSSPSASLASSSSTSSDLNPYKKREMGRKRIGEAECNLPKRGTKVSGPSLDDRRSNGPNNGISISGSRRTRDDDVTGARIQRSIARTRVNERQDRNGLPRLTQPAAPIDTNFSGSQHHPSSNQRRAFGRLGASRANVYSNRSLTPLDAGFRSSSMVRENSGDYSLDGIAEMLLALDRIEQDEDLTYEQLLVMETNHFLGGLTFHDQHRDMRLDIDDMSYEELLALGERMGTVSTALTEEALVKCLKRSVYRAAAAEQVVVGKDEDEEDDIKCSICQEEYKEGDDVGRLGCEHQYHINCIHQWLRLKNWCPICKASAAPSSPSAHL